MLRIPEGCKQRCTPTGGVCALSSSTVYELNPTAFQSATASSHVSYVHGSVISICDSPAFEREIDVPVSTSKSDGLGCARGMRAAFLLEGAMALFFYGAWHFWHLAR